MSFPILAPPLALVLALALGLAARPLGAQAPTAPQPPDPAQAQHQHQLQLLILTLAQATRLALQSNPALRTREAQLPAVEGSRREAAALWHHNPELGAELARRRVQAPGAGSSEWEVGIAQPLETGGQQRHRRSAADADLDALQADIEDARRQVGAAVAGAFYAVLAAQQRVEIERRGAALFASTAVAVDQRRAAGEDTRLDANLAQVEAERAQQALSLAEERLIEARSALATVVQLPPGTLPAVSGDLATALNDAPGPDLAQLLASAQTLPRLGALSAQASAARSRLDLERARRYPDVTVGLGLAREGPVDGRERVGRLTLSVPLPFFNRNAAAIGQATSALSQAEIEQASAAREAQVRVQALWQRLALQRVRLQRLERTVLPIAARNQALAARSRQEGQIGLLDQLVVTRQALDAERDWNDALAEYQRTRIDLELAAGWPL